MSNLQNKLTNIASEQEKKQRKDKLLSSLADVLLEKDIDVSEIGDIKKVTVTQRFSKDKEGEPQTQETVVVQLSPKWEVGPEWPVVKQSFC